MVSAACDHAHMAQALRLAERGLHTTQPNPRVGCVLAYGDKTVGEGWHQRAGGPHAEIFALAKAAERARGATAYVTLEPCGLHGRTPPCADALIAAGIARVVVASEDPFQHAGSAIERMRAAGIAVETGLMREAARELNRGFFSRIERGRPWVRVKLAMSLDGRTALANRESKWITGAAARVDVQRWRARSSAILTGMGTVMADDPSLTVRALESLSRAARGEGEGDAHAVRAPGTSPRPSPLPGGERKEAILSPLRVVLDRQLLTPRGAKVLDGDAPTLLLHASDARVVDDRFANAERAVVESSEHGLDLDHVLRLLAARGMNEVQVEAGPTLCGALFAAGLVDELLLYVAPVLLGDSARPLLSLPVISEMSARWNLRQVDQRQVGEDIRLLLRANVT
ncbi:MAG: bifunctional diaminohydroxyphosphoribosylaminopyrimidine deaminase/5-amino-6-(5-phosphoribosylamino)uracil reductase RibD [Dokdonella sp.]